MAVINRCTNPVANLCARMLIDLHNVSESVDINLWDAMSVRPDTLAQINLCVDIQHVSNDKIAGWHRVPIDKLDHVIVECEDISRQHSNIVFYDFMWNRSKAYYLKRPWNYRPWHWYHVDDFELQDIAPAQEKTRWFLCPNKVTTQFRQQLADLLSNYSGYTNTLQCNSVNCGAHNVKDLSPAVMIQGYRPVHNAYYNETFFSVYTESVELGSTLVATEKTLDPLIKGHFILPFSAAGFVKYIVSKGWKLPTFIDYSYDTISDDTKRFYAFAQEFKRLCSLSLNTWRQLWLDNLDIIVYNRNQLYNRPYDRLRILDEM